MKKRLGVIYDRARPILESKGMDAIFQKKGKYLKIWAKMY